MERAPSTPEPGHNKAQFGKKIVTFVLFTTAVLAAFMAGRVTSPPNAAAHEGGFEAALHTTGETARTLRNANGNGYGSLAQELSQIWAAIEEQRTDTDTENNAIADQLNDLSVGRQAAVAQLNVSLQTTFTNLQDIITTTSANFTADLQAEVSRRQEEVAEADATLQTSIDSLSTTVNAELVNAAAERSASDSNLENILACRPGLIRDPNDSTKCIPCGENQIWSARLGGCSNCPAHSTPGSTSCICDPGYAKNDELCEDVDECATNNGDCGDLVFVTCTNNVGAPPTCTDIDECATNNGGCGDPTLITCTNNVGAAPTCTDIQPPSPPTFPPDFKPSCPASQGTVEASGTWVLDNAEYDATKNSLTSAGTWNNNGAQSVATTTHIKWRCCKANSEAFVGLSHGANNLYACLDFRTYCHLGGGVYYSERPTSFASGQLTNWAPEDVFEQKVNAEGHVEYIKNGAIIKTSTATVGDLPLILGATFSGNGEICDIELL